MLGTKVGGGGFKLFVESNLGVVDFSKRHDPISFSRFA